MARQSKVSRQKHKDKKIILYRSVEGKDEIGCDTIVGYKPIHPGRLWAYVRQLSGQERFAAMAIQVEEEMLFVINWRKDLSTVGATGGLFLEYNGCWYNITRIDTFEGYKEDLQLYGKFRQKPDESDILPYSET